MGPRGDHAGRPGGGVFYLTHQRSPPLVVGIAFDLQKHEKTIGADAVVARFKVEGFKDLTAATFAPTLNRSAGSIRRSPSSGIGSPTASNWLCAAMPRI